MKHANNVVVVYQPEMVAQIIRPLNLQPGNAGQTQRIELLFELNSLVAQDWSRREIAAHKGPQGARGPLGVSTAPELMGHGSNPHHGDQSSGQVKCLLVLIRCPAWE